MIRLFWDGSQGGFFIVGSDAEQLLVRQKELYDGAIPSGNSFAALDLIRLARITGEGAFEEKLQLLLKGFSAQVGQNPTAYPQLLMALEFTLGPSQEVVIAAAQGHSEIQGMVQTIHRFFLPNKVVLFHPSGPAGQEIEKLAPFVKGLEALEGKPTVYLCQNYTCQLPVTSRQELQVLLQKQL